MRVLVFLTVGLCGKCRPLVVTKQRFILHKDRYFFFPNHRLFSFFSFFSHALRVQVNLLDNEPGNVPDKNVLNTGFRL